MAGYVYIWEFEVPSENRAEFLRHYDPNGTWAELFRRAPGYLGTTLLQDRRLSTRFLTIDRWTSSEAREAFLRSYQSEYDRIDRLCERLTTLERNLGAYSEVDSGGAR